MEVPLHMKKDKQMTSFESFKKKLLKNKKFRQAYDDLEAEFGIRSLMIGERIKHKTRYQESVKKLAIKVKVTQASISRFESGNYNPTLEWMRNMAHALDADLKVSITPRK